MHIQHPLKKIVEAQKNGIPTGIYSVCSANEYVIEAAMERAMQEDKNVLIESTANQVNQYGGYTGMKPADFREFVYMVAKKTGFPIEKIILGGDHLGPLIWKNEKAEVAMAEAEELVKQYVLAGFTKIHLDTSMHLGDDITNEKLDTLVVAERGARLCRVAENSYKELLTSNPKALHPVYVIGSEVPIPGGSQEAEELTVTNASDFEDTVDCYKKSFMKQKLQSAWENVMAVVVQPGVEFGDETINEYNRDAAKELCNSLKKYPNLVFEGHSTDYQTASALKMMVEDGIAILKVGPGLTFALREALFALSIIESEVLKGMDGYEPSRFIKVVEKAMIENPQNWVKHYHGDERKKSLARKYSYSDRIRYYLPQQEVKLAMEKMIKNLRSVGIPLNILSQYLPIQYIKVRNGELNNDPESLVKDRIINTIDDYYHAIIQQDY
jgi:D-tagatose-1,6-bisphosphate aldolase subunit GatZ/KbaZ